RCGWGRAPDGSQSWKFGTTSLSLEFGHAQAAPGFSRSDQSGVRGPSGWPPHNAVQAPQALSCSRDKCMPRYLDTCFELIFRSAFFAARLMSAAEKPSIRLACLKSWGLSPQGEE